MELGRIRGKAAAETRRVAKRARGAGDSFSVHLDHVDVGGGDDLSIEPVSPISPITSLIASQEAEPEEARDQAGRQWGREALDTLQELRRAIIQEGVTPSHLERLRRVVDNRASRPADPRLQRLLLDIETRARVELAKYGK